MPRYHFHTADGTRLTDQEGSELPNIEAARLEAVRFAGELLKDDPDKLWKDGQWRVEITDDQNIMLATIITVAVDAPPRNA